MLSKSSTSIFISSVAGAMLLGGVCAHMLLAFFGADFLWRLWFVMPTSVFLSLFARLCVGGHGVLRLIRGTLAIIAGFASLVGVSVCISVVYLLMLEAIRIAPAVDLAVFMLFMLFGALFMDFFFAAEFVAILVAVCASDRERELP